MFRGDSLVIFTDLVQHLVTLVENEHFHIAEAELLIADQGVETTRGGHDDVGVGVFVR